MASDRSTNEQWELHLQQRQVKLEEWEARLQAKEQELIRQGAIPGPQSTALDFGSVNSARGTPDDDKAKPEFAKSAGTSFGHYISSGKFLRSFVFGGLDGLTTTMVLVCSVSGLGFAPADTPQQAMASAGAVLTLGTANAIADAFSMGMGELLSSLADGDTEDSNIDRLDAIRNSLMMFGSFILFGFAPLFAYTSLYFYLFGWLMARIKAAWILAIGGLFTLGLLKGYVTAGPEERNIQMLLKNGGLMVCTGGIASTLSYVISVLLHTEEPGSGVSG